MTGKDVVGIASAILFLLALAWYAYAATRGLRNGVAAAPDSFREAQTLWGVYSIAKRGAAELPALGCDDQGEWCLPFEFPAYQWAAAQVWAFVNHGQCD